jgi:hypothetical protein
MQLLSFQQREQLTVVPDLMEEIYISGLELQWWSFEFFIPFRKINIWDMKVRFSYTVILFNSHHRVSDLIRFMAEILSVNNNKYFVFEKWTCSLYWRRHLDPEQKCFQLLGTEIILFLSMKCNKYFVCFNVYITNFYSAISVHLKVHKHEILTLNFFAET